MRRLSRHTPRMPMAAVAALTMVGSGVTWAGTTDSASATSSDACWATAVTASACGGMSALIAAAKAEGHLTVTTDPETWANYGTIISGFREASMASRSSTRTRTARAPTRSTRST